MWRLICVAPFLLSKIVHFLLSSPWLFICRLGGSVFRIQFTFDGLIRDVCKQALENDIATLERFDFNVALVIPLAAEEIPTLAQKISSLPLEYMNTLFFRYCFDFSPEDTDDMLETTHSVGRLRYVRNMLSPSLWDWMEPWSMTIPWDWLVKLPFRCMFLRTSTYYVFRNTPTFSERNWA